MSFEVLDSGEVEIPNAEVHFSPDDPDSGDWSVYEGEAWIYPNGWVELVDAGSTFVPPHQISDIRPHTE